MNNKLCLAVLALFAAISTDAQLKVDSIGNTSIGTISSDTNCVLSVGNTINSNPFGNIGLYTRILDSNTNTDNVTGMFSNLRGISTNDTKTIGIRSCVMSGKTGKMYGVIGYCTNLLSGIGVYGTAGGYGHSTGPVVSGPFAGYFEGPTCVSGTLTATEVVTPSDMRLKENVIAIAEEEENTGSTLDHVMGMNVIKYNYKPKNYVKDEEETELYENEEMAAEAEKIAKLRIQQAAEQKHYGLSAQELKEIFPDLVRESQDGTLGINYVELVPVLIRSIQELKEKIDELEGMVEADGSMSRRANTAVATENASKNILFQNRPNPFKEKTEIQFQITSEAKDAAICFFDLSGRLKKSIPIKQGMGSVTVSSYELGEGMFLYSLFVDGQEIDTKRMILSK